MRTFVWLYILFGLTLESVIVWPRDFWFLIPITVFLLILDITHDQDN